MVIKVKNCLRCPLITEISFGIGSNSMYECSRGAFGASEEKPKRDGVHECCPLNNSNIIIKLDVD